jgi:hypothetical protein
MNPAGALLTLLSNVMWKVRPPVPVIATVFGLLVVPVLGVPPVDGVPPVLVLARLESDRSGASSVGSPPVALLVRLANEIKSSGEDPYAGLPS